MHTVQKRSIEGLVTVTGATPTGAITIPVLPKDGAWSLAGHVIAVDEASPRSSVTFFPRFSGTCTAGVVTQNNTTKISCQPSDGGRGQTWEPGGLTVTMTGQQLEIEVTGIEGKTLVWAWALDLLVVSLG
jgi:hypothetical protein